MRKQANTKKDQATARDIILISKIYQSFEALEETLGNLFLLLMWRKNHLRKSFLKTLMKPNRKSCRKNAAKNLIREI